MLNWLLPGDCPVEGEARLELDESMSRLIEWMRPERVAEIAVVQPSEEFYPDPYDGSVESMASLVTRTVSHLNQALASTGQPVTGETVRLDPAFSAEPTALIGTVVQQLCAERLANGGFVALFPEDFSPTDSEEPGQLAGVTSTQAASGTESWIVAGMQMGASGPVDETPAIDASRFARLASLLSVFTGFGIFTGNSSVKDTSCSGGACQTVGSLAALNLREYGYAMARLAAIQDRPADWDRQLRPDLKATFRQAQRFLKREAA